jgi:hypothetical protein
MALSLSSESHHKVFVELEIDPAVTVSKYLP